MGFTNAAKGQISSGARLSMVPFENTVTETGITVFTADTMMRPTTFNQGSGVGNCSGDIYNFHIVKPRARGDGAPIHFMRVVLRFSFGFFLNRVRTKI